MKKILIVITILLLLGCTKEVKEENKNEDIKMSAQNITNENMTIIIENNTEEDIMIKPGFKIEQYQNNEWKELKENQKCSNKLGYGIDKKNMLDLNIDWKCEYGTLKQGHYRLIKYLENGKYIKVDFEI
ncbi:predicted protein [Firmicutes bacterium CAG:884]|mgnify:CR=1 FL=1|jgi:hypothetical protein|nr:hypothetical protein [Bacillota bacterium]CCY94409.1 predicted protein [Firmicutes bacterium CAG:884]